MSARDRKSTRLNSSHVAISYAVFCLKKKNEKLADGFQFLEGPVGHPDGYLLFSDPNANSIYFFFFKDTATTDIYTLSLHDALPIRRAGRPRRHGAGCRPADARDYCGRAA